VYAGEVVFAQLMEFLPRHEFDRCVRRYRGNRRVREFSCRDQFLCMAFAQLSYRESLRDIETCLRAMQPKLYHAGFRSRIARSTLADANERRDWRIYADLAHVLIGMAQKLYANDGFAVELDAAAYAFDSTTIDLCLSLFPWARFRRRKGAVKLHTLLDLRGNIPTFIRITPAQLHDVNILDHLTPEPGALYVMDRGYLDFDRLYRWTQGGAFFVTRAKKNLRCRRLYSHSVDKSTGVQCDQAIALIWYRAAKGYPVPLRRVRYWDAEQGRRLVFLTNHFDLSARTIADLYRCRWQVELFFKWIKQHLRIKAFYGTSENAVKTQVWIAVTVYLLVAIVRKRLNLEPDLYTILQILSVSVFEKTPLFQALSSATSQNARAEDHNQLSLFDL